MPDWAGRIWFVSARAWSGTSIRSPARCKSVATGERIGNSFAVDETGGVYIVSERAMYRFDAGTDGAPARRPGGEAYDNIGMHEARPDAGRLGHDAHADGQCSGWRSPTTPTR